MTKKSAAGLQIAGGTALLQTAALLGAAHFQTAAAHGKGEIEIFAYLLEEPGFLKLTAGIIGAVIFLMGVFIAWQGDLVWRKMADEKSEESAESRARMIAPGAAFALVGAAIIVAAVFILPDRVISSGHLSSGHQTEQKGAAQKAP